MCKLWHHHCFWCKMQMKNVCDIHQQHSCFSVLVWNIWFAQRGSLSKSAIFQKDSYRDLQCSVDSLSKQCIRQLHLVPIVLAAWYSPFTETYASPLFRNLLHTDFLRASTFRFLLREWFWDWALCDNSDASGTELSACCSAHTISLGTNNVTASFSIPNSCPQTTSCVKPVKSGMLTSSATRTHSTIWCWSSNFNWNKAGAWPSLFTCCWPSNGCSLSTAARTSVSSTGCWLSAGARTSVSSTGCSSSTGARSSSTGCSTPTNSDYGCTVHGCR